MEVSKKKPGRPKKQVVSPPKEHFGIVSEPQVPGDVVELVYYNPLLFKKLFALQKAFSVSEVELYFTTTCTQIRTVDHLKKSRLYVTIEGKYMNLYHCKEPIRICVKLCSLERAMKTLTKDHEKITFILRENYRSTLYCIFKNGVYQMDDTYEIDVIYRPEDPPVELQDDVDYPLRFKLDFKHFRTQIGSIKKMSTIFNIQKIKDEPLMLTYPRVNDVSWVRAYNNPERINLVSTLSPDDILSVNVTIDYILPFSNWNVLADVYIAVDKTRPISFLTQLDQQSDGGFACTLRIFTEIRNF